MFDQVASIIARKSIASHANLIKICKGDKEKLKQLRSKNGWTVLQFAIYKEDAECVQILASSMPELVNVVGNSVLPIQAWGQNVYSSEKIFYKSAFNLHMRDEHTLQQRQIIHILIDFGAVGVFRALMSRQYMCAPNYERNFIGWTIRTMLRVSSSKSQVTAVNVVNDAFKLDIEEIIRQKKRDVYKNEIKLIVKLGNKINKGLLFNEIVQEIDNPTIEVTEEMPELEETTVETVPEVLEEITEAPEESSEIANETELEVTDNTASEDQKEEVIDAESAPAESAPAEDEKSNSLEVVIESEPEKVEKLLENVKEVGSALSNLVSSATKSEEILNESVSVQETSQEATSTQLEETVDKSTLEQSIDEINLTIQVAEEPEAKGEESIAERTEAEEPVAKEIAVSDKLEAQPVASEDVQVTEVKEEDPVEVIDAPENDVSQAENVASDNESNISTVKVESGDVPVEEPVEISEDSLEATQKDNVDKVAEDPPATEQVIETLPELGSPPSSTGDEVEVAEYAAIAEKTQTEEVIVVEENDVIVEAETEVTVAESPEIAIDNTTEESLEIPTEEAVENTTEPVAEEVVEAAETSAEEIPATTDSFVVVDDSIQSVEESAELIEKESDEIEHPPGDDKPEVSEDINDEFNNEIPSNAKITTPNVDIYQLEYTTDEQTNEESAHKMVLLKQAEDVIFSEGTTSVTDGQDTGVCNRKKGLPVQGLADSIERLNPFISSDECLSDASSTNHEDILSDGSTTLSPLSDIESLSEYLDAEEKLELEMSLRKEFDDYGKADLSIEDISQIRCDKGTQTDDDFELQKAACRAAIESVLKFDSLEHCGRASLSKAQYVRFWVLMASLQRIDESKLNQSMTNLYQSALPLFKHIPKLSK